MPVYSTIGTTLGKQDPDASEHSLSVPAPSQFYAGTHGNLSSYYCHPPEDRVYINFPGGLYSPAVLSVRTGAFIIWNGYSSGTTHTITANATANGSLPFFNGTLSPMDQWAYTFSIPGNYYYYDLYNPSNKGEIIVHPAIVTGSGTLGVDMNPSTPAIVDSYANVTGSSV